MARTRRCIGIEIDSTHISAVQIAQTHNRFLIERSFSTQTRRASDSPHAILKSLVGQHGFHRRAAVAATLPQKAVFFRNVTTDSKDIESLERGDNPKLKNSFPIDPDDIVPRVCAHTPSTDGKYSVLMTAAAKTDLQRTLKLLDSASMHPCLIEPAIIATCSTIAVNHPESRSGKAVVVYVDASHVTLAIAQDGNLLIIRRIPKTVTSEEDEVTAEQIAEQVLRELQVTWQRVLGAPIEPHTRLYLLADDRVGAYLTMLANPSLECDIVPVDPYARVHVTAKCRAAAPQYTAEGLALAVLAPKAAKRVNFLKASADAVAGFSAKREILKCAAIFVTIIGFLLIGIFARVSGLENTYATTKQQIAGLFRKTLPEEKNLVNPVAQMEQKLDTLRKDHQALASFVPGSFSPLQILSMISANAASEGGLEVDDLLIVDDTVRMNGTCDSFDAVYAWQRRLQEVPNFALVEVQDVQKEPSNGRVSFTMVLAPEIEN